MKQYASLRDNLNFKLELTGQAPLHGTPTPQTDVTHTNATVCVVIQS